MPRGIERRAHLRVDFQVPVVIVEGSSVRSHTPRDLSAGGVYLYADEIPALGARVHAELVLGHHTRFATDGIVVRTDAAADGDSGGFAVQFNQMNEAERVELADAIAATQNPE